MATRNFIISTAVKESSILTQGFTRGVFPLGRLIPDPDVTPLVYLTFRDSYLALNYWWRVSSNGVGGNSVLTFWKNGGPGNQVITVPGGATGAFQDSTHTDTLTNAQTMCHKIVIGAGGTGMAPIIGAFQLQCAATADVIVGQSGGLAMPTSSIIFWPITGSSASQVGDTEADINYKLRSSGTFSHMAVFVYGNTLTSTSTIVSRVNSGNGNQTLTIGSGASGLFEDTTHTDVVSPGDSVCMKLTTGATGTQIETGDVHSMKFDSSSQPLGSTHNYYDAASDLDHGAVYYFNIWTSNYGAEQVPVEINAQQDVLFSCSFRNLVVNVKSYSLDSPCTISFRKNGVSENLAVTVNATGTFEDTTHYVNLVATDLINTKVDTSAASAGSVEVTLIGIELNPTYELPSGAGLNPALLELL